MILYTIPYSLTVGKLLLAFSDFFLEPQYGKARRKQNVDMRQRVWYGPEKQQGCTLQPCRLSARSPHPYADNLSGGCV
ncbi:hypothetical protein KL86DPRO_10686 [uncultured delta proteobacterium]|uniref:Uncharacterized protein n=1 Tax=uncultured delta proteobacterium TaxID=34034 RepID=A0A212J4I7_9DELT|nr:hypothetical protein KL86DPRO_10686 [uncultured delta proteobacterium]